MKLVSWMVCWRHCSRALPSGEREDHGKQVHKQSSTSLKNMQMWSLTCFKDLCFLSHTVAVCILYWHMWSIWESFVPSPCNSVSMFLSTHNNIFVCVPHVSVPSVAWLRDRGGWLYFLARVTRGKSQFTMSWHNNKRRGRVWAAGYLREGQLVGVWLWNRKI